MKIPKEFTVPIVVHAISKLDLQLLDGILRPIPESIKDKIDIAQIIFCLKLNMMTVFNPDDTYFEVIHENEKDITCNTNIYKFTANNSRLGFTLQIQQDEEGMITIKDHSLENSNKPKKHILFFGEEEEAPF
ncbi:MAG: hypothetical protein KA210_01070 [Bacteroidia bacterium]|nr:hypothetical protein [Bacteroidia bacterium]